MQNSDDVSIILIPQEEKEEIFIPRPYQRTKGMVFVPNKEGHVAVSFRTPSTKKDKPHTIPAKIVKQIKASKRYKEQKK